MASKDKSKIRKTVQFSSANHPVRRIRRFKEFLIEGLLFLCAASSVLVTLGIVGILVVESIPFFAHVNFLDFITGKEWTPMFSEPQFGILPLISGTLLTTFIALLVAIPMGTVIATFLSEYVPNSQREVIKPILEILAAVPTVVYGYFALLFVSPLLQKYFRKFLASMFFRQAL